VSSDGDVTIELTDAEMIDLLAIIYCHVDHEHDMDTCIPEWVHLGEN
jgi:hypothetical protein